MCDVKMETFDILDDILDDNDFVILHGKELTVLEKSRENLVFSIANVAVNILLVYSQLVSVIGKSMCEDLDRFRKHDEG